MINTELSDWLLDSDPSLRWQVERDLLSAEDTIWQGTRARVGTKASVQSCCPTRTRTGNGQAGPTSLRLHLRR